MVGATLLVLTLSALLALSMKELVPAQKSEKAISTFVEERAVVDPEVARHHKLLQQELKDAVATYFQKAIRLGDIVGAGVSIVQGDSILLSEGFGKRNSNGKDRVNRQTVFRLGSLSKGFTGVLAADLKDEGKLEWDDKVIDYIPEFQLGDANNTGKITLAHILSHTSGTPYHSFTNLVDAGISVREIAKRFNEVTPISEPGEMYSYQNAIFALSGEIMKEATGSDISTLLQNRFFKPLGMKTASTDSETLVQQKNVAMPHVKRRRGWKSTSLTDSYYNAVAAGGIDASASDMAKWMRFLLGHNPEVMKKSALSEAFEPQVEINIGRKYYKRWPGHVVSHYAFGWRVHEFVDEHSKEKQTVWHHGGSVNRYRNEIALYPESDLGICVLLNSNSRLARTVIPDLHQIVREIYQETSEELPKESETVSSSFE